MIVGYVRISVKDNEGESIVNQISLIKEYCQKRNYPLDKIYVDDGVSGISYDRGGFKELIKDILAKRIEIIIIKDISRLGRDAIETSYYINYFFSEHRVNLISLDGFMEETLINIKSIMNEAYVKDVSSKRRNTAYFKTRNREYIGIKAPYGYKIKYIENKRTLVIDEYEANIVRMIFKCRLEGNSFEGILSYLRNVIDSSYFQSWNSLKIRRILENVVYKGDLVIRKSIKNNYKEKRKYISKNNYEIISGAFPSIISEDSFSKANLMVKKYKKHKREKEKSVYEGIIFCSNCKIYMSYYQRYKGYNYQYYFRCSKCGKSIFLSRLNKLVETSLSKLLESINRKKILETVGDKVDLYLKESINKLTSKKKALYIKYKELYKRKYCRDTQSNYLDEIQKVSLNIKQLDERIEFYRCCDFKNDMCDFLADINLLCIIEKVEVNRVIKIYYQIKKA